LQGYGSATFTFPAPTDGNRVTLTTSQSSTGVAPFAGQVPFVVTVTAPNGLSQIYNNTNIQKLGDSLGVIPTGQVDFSGPISVPALSNGSNLYTVTYQSLNANSQNVTFNLVEIPSDQVQSASVWPTKGTQQYQFTISQPGQGIELDVAGQYPISGVNALVTMASATGGTSAFDGCFGVSIFDVGNGAYLYRALQCGGLDATPNLPPARETTGPYKIRVYGVGTGIGGFQLLLSNGSILNNTSIKLGAPVSTSFTAPGQQTTLTLSGVSPGAFVQFATTIPSGWSGSQCLIAALSTSDLSSPIATYEQCPGTAPASIGSVQLPNILNNKYTIVLATTGGATGQVQSSLTSGTSPSQQLPINGSATVSIPSISPVTATSNPLLVNGANTTAPYINLVTQPTLPAQNSMNGVTQTNPALDCYNVEIDGLINEITGKAASYYSTNQHSQQTGVDASCSGYSSVSVSSAQIVASSATSVAPIVTVSNATGVAYPAEMTEILFYYEASTASSGPALTLPTNGQAGIIVPSAWPGQPAVAQYTPAATQFVQFFVGFNTSWYSLFNISPNNSQKSLYNICAKIYVLDLGTNPNAVTGSVIFQDTDCELSYTTGAVFLPNAGDTYRLVVYPYGIAVGNISIGLGAS